jgi:catechol 2,3-dioxygenase-like lactoylglutathione lyase family enzyme
MKMIFLFTVMSAAFCGLAALGKEDDKPRPARADGAATIRVRYIVNDVPAAVAFYTNNLQFHVAAQAGRNFAIVVRENLQLVLSPPKGPGGASQPMPDGRRPEPGGWNRIILPSHDLEKDVEALKKAGVHFRNNIVSGPGGREILLEDPSGNPIELFEPST